jgi:hypothetical protein
VRNTRTKRAKKARASGNPLLNQEPNQRLDDNDEPMPSIPTGFLSPSVKEYLELGKSIPGRPGADYPILAAVPYTNFYCDEQAYPGFFADVETRCQGEFKLIFMSTRKSLNCRHSRSHSTY